MQFLKPHSSQWRTGRYPELIAFRRRSERIRRRCSCGDLPAALSGEQLQGCLRPRKAAGFQRPALRSLQHESSSLRYTPIRSSAPRLSLDAARIPEQTCPATRPGANGRPGPSPARRAAPTHRILGAALARRAETASCRRSTNRAFTRSRRPASYRRLRGSRSPCCSSPSARTSTSTK